MDDLARTKTLKAITYLVHKKICEGNDCDPLELTQPPEDFRIFISETNVAKRKERH